MTYIKISELPLADTLTGAEYTVVVQDGVTKRVAASSFDGLAGPTSWAGVTDKPETFPPSAHSHALQDVVELEAALLAKVDNVAGKGLSTEDYTTTEKSKLSGIAAGATANATDAQLRDRATHTGEQAISTIDGLQVALDAKEAAGTAAAAVASHAAAGDPHPQYATPAEAAAAAPVQSVAGRTGAVTLAKADVGLGNVDNTSDANKPISTATQAALNSKEGTIASGTTAQFWRGDKTWRDFFTDVRAATLTGLSTATSAAVSAADTVLAAIGKLQAQVSTKVSKTGDTMIGQLTLADQTLPITTNNLPTIRPSLLLDFANGRSVDPRIALTRASAATRTNEKGLIETVAANVPRLDFDPVSGACRGLLIEEQRTNLLTYSEQFDNAAWIKIGATIATNVITAPDGTLTADKLVEDTSAGSHRVVAGAYGLANNTVRCLSVFSKSSERNSVTLTINAYSGNYIRATFNLLTGAVTSSAFGKGALASAQAENVGGGYWRLSLAGAPDSTSSTVACDHSIQADGSYTGDGTSGFYIWGTQLEAGTFPTSYIPTTVAQVTRAADTATMTGANFSSWCRQDEGAFVVFARRDSLSAGRLITLSDGTANNQIRINLAVSSTSLRADLEVVTGGVSQVSTMAQVFSVGSLVAIAFAYKANDFAISVNGATVVTDTSGAVPPVDRMHIGTDHAGANSHNDTVARIACYPKRPSSAELQALSTP